MGLYGFPSDYAHRQFRAGCRDFLESRTVCPICGDARFSYGRNHRTKKTEAKYDCGLILELDDSSKEDRPHGGVYLSAPCRTYELEWIKAVNAEQAEIAVREADREIIKLEGGADG